MRYLVLLLVIAGCAPSKTTPTIPVVKIEAIKRSYSKPDWEEPVSKAKIKRVARDIKVWTGSVTEWIQMQYGCKP